VREGVIRELDLQRRFRQPNLDLCLKDLDARIDVGVMQSARSSSRRRPGSEVRRGTGNTFIAELDSVNIRIQQDKARRTRRYLDGQMLESGPPARRGSQAHRVRARARRVHGTEEQGSRRGGPGRHAARIAGAPHLAGFVFLAGQPALKAIDSELAAIEQNVGRLPGFKQEARASRSTSRSSAASTP